MKIRGLAFSAVVPAMVFTVAAGQKNVKTSTPRMGQVIHGFKLEKKQFVKEANAEGYLFHHEQSGAKLLKLFTKDDNKVFSVTFKTPPSDDTGLPHIMEHSVLNGSDEFPVKSPFDVLIQGSLKTFLNAMTFDEFTTYPVASRNDKDFKNLMHVYLDAVYRPALLKEYKILQQEGWHYELDSSDAPLTIKGVVYNEMKGAYSAPEEQMGLVMSRTLFPDNAYGKSSGGHPDAIPQLTQAQFEAFHKQYYHPSNSHIFLYGNGDMEQELAFINEKYLKGVSKIQVDVKIPLQKALPEPQVVKSQYGIPEGTPTDFKTYISKGLVYGSNADQETNLALDILAQVLVNNEAAPLRVAMQKAGIGKDISAYVNKIEQPVFTINVTNAQVLDADRFEQIYQDTLRDVVSKGFDRAMLEGVINRYEFSLREGNGSSTGISAAIGSVRGWLATNNPFSTLSFDKELASIRTQLDKRYFENLIEKAFLKNAHACMVVMEPKSGLEKEIVHAEEARLAKLKASMAPEQIASIVEQTKQLMAYQQRKDSPEVLKTVPLLEIADIDKKQEELVLKHERLAGIPILHMDTFTKGIAYVNCYFDTQAVPQDMIPYLELYSNLVGMIPTNKLSYGDLQNQMNLHTGGIVTRLETMAVNGSDDQIKTYFVMSGKALSEKLPQMFDLMKQQQLDSKWDDEARLKEMVTRVKTQFEQGMAYNSLGIARTRLKSYMTNRGAYEDLTSGFGYYRFLCQITKENDYKALASKLKSLQASIINKSTVRVGVTGQAEQLKAIKETLPTLLRSLPNTEVKPVAYTFAKEALNEGFQDASKVQYVLKGSDYKKLGYSYSGKMEVLSQLLSTVYLQNTVRVQGGAYGGFAVMDNAGFLGFASYRDPNLKKTVENYQGAGRFLADLKLDERELRRLIIGTISKRDYPLDPERKGDVAVRRFLRGEQHAKLQTERDEILSTSLEDLKGFAKMVQDVMNQNAICVVGNEKKIEDDKSLFKTVLALK